MGRKAKPQPHRIAALLPGVLRDVERRHEALTTVQQAWRALVGKQAAAHTRPVGLQRGRLVVYAERPGDSFLLSYQRSQVLERLRELTNGRVEELVVRPGRGPDSARWLTGKPGAPKA